ncbi:hypothetical protein BCL76_11546 [Streptomyces sp. CG 926]|nr:hypothetical protein BCL76_11546 [Streptomyces sp. CG 926]
MTSGSRATWPGCTARRSPISTARRRPGPRPSRAAIRTWLQCMSCGAAHGLLGCPPGCGDQTVSAGQFLVRHLGPSRRRRISRRSSSFCHPASSSPCSGPEPSPGRRTRPEALADDPHRHDSRRTGRPGPGRCSSCPRRPGRADQGGGEGPVRRRGTRLAPALTQVARDLANRRLADPDPSPAMLARELNVSVRTRHGAFAAVGEQVTTYIRHRRLHEVRLTLVAPSGRLSTPERGAILAVRGRQSLHPSLQEAPRSPSTTPRSTITRPREDFRRLSPTTATLWRQRVRTMPLSNRGT